MGKIAHNSASVKRFFLNTFAENPMQEAIDITLGKHTNQGYSQEMQKHINRGLQAGLEGMTETEDISLSVYSWSLGGNCKPMERVEI